MIATRESIREKSWQRQGWLAKKIGRLTGYTILILTASLLVLPVLSMALASLKVDSELIKYPIEFLPRVPQWLNYAKVFTMTPFVTIAWRTFLLALTSTTISVVISSMCGFAFARYNVPGSGRLFLVVISLLIVPGIVLLIPQFILFARLHLTNSYWPWYLGALGGSPTFIFMFRQFFLGFPIELEEAAEVDGCSPFRIYAQIFLPNAKPVIATAMIFGFIGVWGDYLTPTIYLSASKTLMGVAMATAFVDPRGNELKTISQAASVIYILPLIVMFFLAQKHILKGVVTSGLKG
jgi:ABC-type glycerol-3-phosphate transport system permease component